MIYLKILTRAINITLALHPVALMLVTDAGDEMLWRQVRGKVANIVFFLPFQTISDLYNKALADLDSNH